jgi:hypothetical protein
MEIEGTHTLLCKERIKAWELFELFEIRLRLYNQYPLILVNVSVSFKYVLLS